LFNKNLKEYWDANYKKQIMGRSVLKCELNISFLVVFSCVEREQYKPLQSPKKSMITCTWTNDVFIECTIEHVKMNLFTVR
jgi:hypothetical protein